MNADMVFTPGGQRPRSDVIVLEPSQLVVLSQRIQTRLRKDNQAGRPDKANWISAAWIDVVGPSMKSFSTTWTVPPEPKTTGAQLLYLFNGMQPPDGSTIVQPVLQWGDSGPDQDGQNRTGHFWTVASWIVPAPDGRTYHTPHLRVNPGDNLVGVIRLVKNVGGNCTYACEFRGLAATRFITPAIPELTWCVQTLEAYELNTSANPPYDLDVSSEYPGAKFTAFESIAIDGAPSGALWTVTDYVTKYGEHTIIKTNSTSGGQVQIYYGSGAAVSSSRSSDSDHV